MKELSKEAGNKVKSSSSEYQDTYKCSRWGWVLWLRLPDDTNDHLLRLPPLLGTWPRWDGGQHGCPRTSFPKSCPLPFLLEPSSQVLGHCLGSQPERAAAHSGGGMHLGAGGRGPRSCQLSLSLRLNTAAPSLEVWHLLWPTWHHPASRAPSRGHSWDASIWRALRWVSGSLTTQGASGGFEEFSPCISWTTQDWVHGS